MAGVRARVSTGAEIALTAATEKTVLQLIAASNHRVKVKGWGISFDGVTSTNEPVVVRVAKQTSAGTATSVSPVKNGDYGETLQTTATKNATVEPTTTDEYARVEVHPQGGNFSEYFPFEDPLEIPGGGRLGILATAPAGVNCVAYFVFEE